MKENYEDLEDSVDERFAGFVAGATYGLIAALVAEILILLILIGIKLATGIIFVHEGSLMAVFLIGLGAGFTVRRWIEPGFKPEIGSAIGLGFGLAVGLAAVFLSGIEYGIKVGFLAGIGTISVFWITWKLFNKKPAGAKAMARQRRIFK